MGGTGIPRMVDGGAKMEEDAEPWAKITSVVYWGKNQDDEMPDVAGWMPRHAVDASFCGPDHTVDLCGHKSAPVRRVCNGGVDTGRRFLSCYYEDARTCGYVKWIDKPWQGRERSVIAELASKNEVLEKKLVEKVGEIEAEKEKHKMEKKMTGRMHRDQLQSRDRMIMFAVCMYFGLVAIMFAMFDRK